MKLPYWHIWDFFSLLLFKKISILFNMLLGILYEDENDDQG